MRMGLSQIDLAAALKVSQSTICAWENGTRNPSAKQLFKLAAFFGTTVEKLVIGA